MQAGRFFLFRNVWYEKNFEKEEARFPLGNDLPSLSFLTFTVWVVALADVHKHNKNIAVNDDDDVLVESDPATAQIALSRM